MWKLLGVATAASVLLISLPSSEAQCQQCGRRGDLMIRPHSWNILPMRDDSPCYDISLAFNDDWPYQLREIPGSQLAEHRNSLWHQAQRNAEPECNELSKQEQYHRQREINVEQEMARLAHARKEQRLIDLNREEQSLINQHQKYAKQYQQSEQILKMKREDIQRIRAEVFAQNPMDNMGDAEFRAQLRREVAVNEMKKRQERMAEEQHRLAEAKSKQQRQAALLEEQRRQAEIQEQQRQQAEIQEQRRLAEINEQKRQAQLEKQRRYADLEAERIQYREHQRRQSELREERLQESMSRDRNRNHHEHRNFLMAQHQVKGYDPDDISIKIADGRIKVDGKHVCHCNENCITREFSRSYVLPVGMDPLSAMATMDGEGNIRVHAQQNGRQGSNTEEATVRVIGEGIPQSNKLSADELRKCLGEKGGIKLNKINKSTGQVHIDEKYQYEQEVLKPRVGTGDDSYDHDDGYIEVEDYL